MFTGIVEERGIITDVERQAGGARLRIEAPTIADGAEVGASIAVDGCCLTVVERGDGWWTADAVTETLERSTLGGLRPGDHVNLERPTRLGDTLDGHLVQGHVDGVGQVAAREPLLDGSTRVSIACSPSLVRYVVEKGSIAVDGISLTVTDVDDDPPGFSFAVIPHTAEVTTLGSREVGDTVNIEVDILAKYVERLLDRSSEET